MPRPDVGFRPALPPVSRGILRRFPLYDLLVHKDTRPLVTIVTPTYNRGEYLPSSMASVRLQSYEKIEHIVIDGASTDNSLEILERAKTHWGVKYISQPDQGMYHAVNHGLTMARGQIVGWLNSDDWLLPWAVECVVNAFGRKKAAYFGDLLTVDSVSDVASPQIYGKFHINDLAAGGNLGQPAVFWPATAMALAGLPRAEKYDHVADCDYWFQLAEIVPFVKLREFLAVTIDHDGTKRSAFSDAVIAELYSIQQDRYDLRRPRSWQKKITLTRRRMEWAAFLAGRGWHASEQGDLLNVGALRNPKRLALAHRSPFHPNPLGIASSQVFIGGFRQNLAQTSKEISS